MNWQPRFAAFAASLGRTDTAFNTTAIRVEFVTAFLPRCKRTAPAGTFVSGVLVDPEGFTAHCWAVAQSDLLRNFPA